MRHLKRFNESQFPGKFNWKGDEHLIKNIFDIARDENIKVEIERDSDYLRHTRPSDRSNNTIPQMSPTIKVSIINDGQENYKDVCINIINRLQQTGHTTTVKLYRDRKGILSRFRTREVIITDAEEIRDYDIIDIKIEIEHYFKQDIENAFDDILNIARDEGYDVNHKFDSTYKFKHKARFLLITLGRNDNSVEDSNRMLDDIMRRLETIITPTMFKPRISYLKSSYYYQKYNPEHAIDNNAHGAGGVLKGLNGLQVVMDVYGHGAMNDPDEDLSDYEGIKIIYPIHVKSYEED